MGENFNPISINLVDFPAPFIVYCYQGFRKVDLSCRLKQGGLHVSCLLPLGDGN